MLASPPGRLLEEGETGPLSYSHRSACLIVAALAGCGSPAPSLGLKPPHGGTMFALTDPKGSVEVVRQDVADKPGQSRIFLYYYGPELKPMTPTLTVATLKPKERGASLITFKPTGDADPARAGELASDPFPSADDVAGELSATIDGKPTVVNVNVR